MIYALLEDLSETNTDGAAACAAGVIKLVIREFSSTNVNTPD